MRVSLEVISQGVFLGSKGSHRFPGPTDALLPSSPGHHSSPCWWAAIITAGNSSASTFTRLSQRDEAERPPTHCDRPLPPHGPAGLPEEG